MHHVGHASTLKRPSFNGDFSRRSHPTNPTNAFGTQTRRGTTRWQSANIASCGKCCAALVHNSHTNADLVADVLRSVMETCSLPVASHAITTTQAAMAFPTPRC